MQYLLLQENIDIDIKFKGKTALDWARCMNKAELIESLITAGARNEIQMPTPMSNFPLQALIQEPTDEPIDNKEVEIYAMTVFQEPSVIVDILSPQELEWIKAKLITLSNYVNTIKNSEVKTCATELLNTFNEDLNSNQYNLPTLKTKWKDAITVKQNILKKDIGIWHAFINCIKSLVNFFLARANYNPSSFFKENQGSYEQFQIHISQLNA